MKKYNYTPDIDDKNYLKKIISEKNTLKIVQREMKIYA